jgi:uncharacterized membrane protein YfcA
VTADFLSYVVIGFVAQLVDGTIGMAYGVISTTALLSAGLSPLNVTANIHFAELLTGGVSGAFHARRGQVSWPLVKRLALTGSVGAFVGAVLLVTVATRWLDGLRRAIALYLLILGGWLCWRALKRPEPRARVADRTAALGLAGGLFDSTGGGWGPIVTSNLMVAGVTPAVAVGSSVVAEFVVTAVHAAVFAGLGGLRPELPMAGLLAGGVIAAPIAARLAARLPPRIIIGLVGIAVVIASVLLILR